MKKFTLQLLSLTLCLLLMNAGFNLLVDPYGLFQIVNNRFNQVKPFQNDMEQLFKPIALYRARSNFVIAGSSVAQYAFNPQLVSSHGYNLGIDGPTISEVTSFLKFGMRNSSVKRAVVALELLMFNGARGLSNARYNSTRMGLRLADGTDGYLNSAEGFRVLVSNDALMDSLQTLGSQSSLPYYDVYGFIPNQYCDDSPQANYPAAFTASIAAYTDMHRNSLKPYTQTSEKIDLWRFFDDLLQSAYDNNIKLVIVISPMHERFREALIKAGLGTTFKEWRKQVAAQIKWSGTKNNRLPFRLYDYTEDTRNQETVPLHQGQTMVYWNDGYHPSHHYGAEILAEILKETPTESPKGH